jgi:hypothetical protein
MNGIYCANCGVDLGEAPTLLPDQRPPCPRCGSLARRFEREVTDQIVLTDRGTGADTLTVTRTDSSDVFVHAQPAEVIATAVDPTVEVEESHDGRTIKDQLVVMGRSLWWTQLTEEPTWMVQVVDEVGEVLAVGVGDNQIDALAGVADALLPGHPG